MAKGKDPLLSRLLARHALGGAPRSAARPDRCGLSPGLAGQFVFDGLRQAALLHS